MKRVSVPARSQTIQSGVGAALSGIPLRVCHPIELVDQAYERAGFYDDGK